MVLDCLICLDVGRLVMGEIWGKRFFIASSESEWGSAPQISSSGSIFSWVICGVHRGLEFFYEGFFVGESGLFGGFMKKFSEL